MTDFNKIFKTQENKDRYFLPLKTDEPCQSRPLGFAAWLVQEPMEQSHPNYSVEASDTCVLTVFPSQWDDEMSDDDVVNYATGMFGQWPALLCMDDSHELLVLRNGRLETQRWQPASM